MKFLFIFIFNTLLFSANVQIVNEFSYYTPKSKVVKQKVYKSSKSKVAKRYFKLNKKIKQKVKTKKRFAKNIKHPKKAKAKLVIIIDDVVHKYQLNTIKALPFKVTPSIFPPNKMNMHSNKLAKGLKHFMVHLPLQSDSKAMNSMHKTLFVKDSNAKINSRIVEIKRLFPNVKFLNNHTGSVFTKNYPKSKELYKDLIKNKINFVDSRTTKKSVFPRLAKEFHKRYYKNDLFIDNKLDTKVIINRIKDAINIAKRRGKAIVIGHPHPQTLKALKLSAKYLKSVNVIYIDEL